MSIDLLMKFVKGSDAIDAECQTTVDSKDDLLHDFKTGKFFEIDEFNFGVGLEDDDLSGEKPGEKLGEKLKPATSAHAPRTRFTNWLRGEQKAYPVDLEPFTFSRQMDQASPLLFEMCCNSQSFTSATLIKRKAAGTDASGRAFLRIDFKDVLVMRRLGQWRCREGEVQVHLPRRGGPAETPDVGRHAGRCGSGELEADDAKKG